eukprot:1760771-Rhodomonas_salina.8
MFKTGPNSGVGTCLEHVDFIVTELEAGQGGGRPISRHQLHHLARSVEGNAAWRTREGAKAARQHGRDQHQVEERAYDVCARNGAQPRARHCPEPCPAALAIASVPLNAKAKLRVESAGVREQGSGVSAHAACLNDAASRTLAYLRGSWRRTCLLRG